MIYGGVIPTPVPASSTAIFRHVHLTDPQRSIVATITGSTAQTGAESTL